MDAVSDVPGPVAVCDPFAVLDLTAHGYSRDQSETWMIRQPAPMFAPLIKGLDIRRVKQAQEVADFERATYANTGNLDLYVAGALHPAEPTLDEHDLALFIGSMNSAPVATAVAVVHPLAVGVQAVTTHRDYRRRGIAQSMLAEVLAAAPNRPAVLAATPMGYELYRAIGFHDAGRGSNWHRP
jgi:GNAT superfamily N-acetyltransferase